MATKPPETPGIRLDVAEELRAGRVQTLRHVAQIAELRARVGALERRWGPPMITAVAAIVTAIGTLAYLLLNHHG